MITVTQWRKKLTFSITVPSDITKSNILGCVSPLVLEGLLTCCIKKFCEVHHSLHGSAALL